MRLGVLAVQGAFAEHISRLTAFGVESFEIRQVRDVAGPFDGLILPGGESTTMRKLLVDLKLLRPLKDMIDGGLPVLGTCAGMILLAKEISGGERACFEAMDVTVRRNAYGRQLGSFQAFETFDGREIEMRFIRAPYVERVGKDVDVLSVVDGKIVAVRQGARLATAFHPELTDDSTVYEYFFKIVEERKDC